MKSIDKVSHKKVKHSSDAALDELEVTEAMMDAEDDLNEEVDLSGALSKTETRKRALEQKQEELDQTGQ
eukprot:11737595-Alexandrium_andersonii.AAC.2